MTKLLVALYFALLFIVFLNQRSFIYHPSKGSRESLEKIAESQGFQAWQNSAGQFIGWKHFSTARGEHGQVLIVHGNAGSAIDRVGIANGLQSVEPMDIYILEYPGFGARPGSPSQQSLFQAASEAMDFLKAKGPVYLMGESLGTGVAAYLAGTYPELIRGVLLIAPYDNLTDVAQYHMPIFPVKWMLWGSFCFRNLSGELSWPYRHIGGWAGRGGAHSVRAKTLRGLSGTKKDLGVAQCGPW